MKEKGLFLGRSVRNYAATSLKSNNLAKGIDETIKKLFFRAILSVYLKETDQFQTEIKSVRKI